MAGIGVDGRCRSLSRIGVRDMLSYQSRMPAGAGPSRYEKPELWSYTANSHGGFGHAQARPQRGSSPSPRVVFDRTTFPIPAPLDSGLRRNDELSGGSLSRIVVRDMLA